MQIGLLLKRLSRSWISFPVQIVFGYKEWQEWYYWIHVFKLEQLVRHNYPYYYDDFDNRILRISVANFCHSVAHVYSQTSDLASFMVEIATKFCNLMSKTIEMKSHVVI